MKRFLAISLARFFLEIHVWLHSRHLAAPLALGVTAVARDTQSRPADIENHPVAATTLISAGALVALDASGNAVNAADTAALRVIGRAEQTVDNTAGSAGDLTINVARGCFLFANSAGQAVTAAYKDKYVYVEDNETVAISSTNFIVAGRVVDVVTAGVWIDTRGKGAVNAKLVTTVGAAVADIAGGEAPTEAEHNALIARVNQLRVDVLAIAAKINGG